MLKVMIVFLFRDFSTGELYSLEIILYIYIHCQMFVLFMVSVLNYNMEDIHVVKGYYMLT